jgi:hypothetical protein
MKLFLFAFGFFLLAFVGLATGLLLKRKGLRGGCGSGRSSDNDCQCKATAKSNRQVKTPLC